MTRRTPGPGSLVSGWKGYAQESLYLEVEQVTEEVDVRDAEEGGAVPEELSAKPGGARRL